MACPIGPDLYPWDVGPAVSELQELLRAHGFNIRVDGDFGWRTEAALKTYQYQHGLKADGVVGQKTWTALQTTVQPGNRLLRQGHAGADVVELQGLLRVNGCTIARDGVFGLETRSAVIAFQRDHHLKGDGIVDSVTWTLLRGRAIKSTSRTKSHPFFSRIRWLS
jgi:peptidoglycan hydrolase-like protein with peptidoglycan-binding domain